MPRPRSNPLFEFNGQWIAAIGNSRHLYRHWLDGRTGRVRRESLGTANLEDAKLKFIGIVIRAAPKTADAPLAIVLETYFEEKTDAKPSAKVARSAGRTLLKGFGETARCSHLTEEYQRSFVGRLITKGFKLSYIARTLSVLAAAFEHSKIKDPEIVASEAKLIATWSLARSPLKKAYIPTDEELARLLASTAAEKFKRWCILSMLTACRPEAAIELAPVQRIRAASIVDLNPPMRAQNKKHRAIVRETRALRVFLNRWEKDRLGEFGDRYCGYTTIAGAKTALKRVRRPSVAAIPALSLYSFRHKVTTVLRRARVGEDEVSRQLGHKRPHLRITAGYGEYDPDYLKAAARAIDVWFLKVWRRAEVIAQERAEGAIHAQQQTAKLKPKIYFVEAVGAGLIKIGKAFDVDDRLRTLATGCPYELRLLATQDGDLKEEIALHRRFAEYSERGEWFRPGRALIAHIERQLETSRTLAARVDISERQVRWLIAEGRVETVAIGKRILIPVGAWDRYLALQKKQHQKPREFATNSQVVRSVGSR